MTKTLAIVLFLALLAAALALGLARDLYSRERRALSGEIVGIEQRRQDFKSTLIRSPRLKVRLDNGTIVDVAIGTTTGFSAGQTVSLSEMETPWGQLWYRIKG